MGRYTHTGGQIVMQQISVTAAPARRASPAPGQPTTHRCNAAAAGHTGAAAGSGLLALRMRRR
ncbi:MAG: hypothetical protein U0Z44_10710 [Kouleothrix sp.]